ncbi:MFS transporter [Lentzea albida]|uniref:Transmembrane secretion effector n=1 Tax=Lentzea albida TaxID=65499 RepID=A0A1H9WH65_9PSEU|nr:MFS transporter [Lentzea albida]SES33248.1 Transmembrane secretion effector [Lentzea albida]
MTTAAPAAAPAAAGPSRLPRSFQWLWASAGSATFADGIYQVALPIAALQLGGGPAAVATVYTAARLPWALTALHAGVLVDRFDRRKIMIIANVVRTLMLLCGAAVVVFGGGVLALAAIAFVLGVAETAGDTAMHSITPRVVGKDQLERANSRMQATELVTRFLVGPAVGGLVAGIALGFSFGAVALLYTAAAVSAVTLVTRDEPSTAPAKFSVREGLAFLFTRRRLAVYALGVGLVNAGYAAFQTALPIVALGDGPLGLTAAQYGLLIGASGVSGLVLGLCAPALVRWLGNRGTLLVGQGVLAVGIATAGLTLSLPLVVLGIAGTGFLVLGSVITVSYRQRAVPDHLLGRVTAAYRLLAFGGLPLGSALAGGLGAISSPRVVLIAAGALVLVAGVGMAAVTPAHEEES